VTGTSGDGAAGRGVEPTFEELMTELESLTARLAAGDLGIEAAADVYERAEKLHAQASERLERVRARVEGLTGSPGSSEASEASGSSEPSD
jgi:exodeoxyribonuclease VII small subunit